MSRWSDQFSSHPIHVTLEEARNFLDVKVKGIDEEREVEKRRLLKALDRIRDTLDGIDPELYPKQLLTQIDNKLRHQNFWSQLQSYSTDFGVQQLRAANDHFTDMAPIVFQLAPFALKKETRKALQSIEKAFDDLSEAIGRSETDFKSRLSEAEQKVTDLEQRERNIRAALVALQSSVGEALKGWETEFTQAQNNREEDHSIAQSEREENFATAIKGLETKLESTTNSISKNYKDRLDMAYEDFASVADTRSKDMRKKHDAILEIHQLVGTDSVAGGYQKSATEEHKSANRWRLISMVSLSLAAGWLLFKYMFGFEITPEGGTNWSEVLTAGSLTLVLLVAAGYASRQSKLHRDAEQQMRWFALEVKAIDPFLSSLEEGDQKEMKKQLSEKLFGRDRTTSDGSGTNLDPRAFRSVAESFLSQLSEAIKLDRKP